MPILLHEALRRDRCVIIEVVLPRQQRRRELHVLSCVYMCVQVDRSFRSALPTKKCSESSKAGEGRKSESIEPQTKEKSDVVVATHGD